MSVRTLTKEISELKSIVNRKNIQFIVTCDFTEAEDKAYYEDLMSKPANKFMKAKTHPFHSWESFLEYHR